MPIKVGIFGGSFDPPHIGHLHFVSQVQEKMQFDQILVIPAKVSPFKVKRPSMIDDESRLAMVKETFSPLQFCKVSEIELQAGGISYTADTIEKLLEEAPEIEYTLILRKEAYETFSMWKRHDWIREKVTLLFATDEEFPKERNKKDLWLPISCLPICSTMIREKLFHRESIEGLVDPKVLDFIHKNHLYSLA